MATRGKKEKEYPPMPANWMYKRGDRVEYITLFCNGFTDARATPKRKASGSNPLRDISQKAQRLFSKRKTKPLRFFDL